MSIIVNNRDQDHGSIGTTFDTPKTSLRKTNASKPSSGANDKSKPPPRCFVCSKPDSKNFLMDCEIFKNLSPKSICQTVIEVKFCLNCLSLDHILRNCPQFTKRRNCGLRSQNKHATALHECFIFSNTGAADKGSNEPGSKNEDTQNKRNERVFWKQTLRTNV